MNNQAWIEHLEQWKEFLEQRIAKESSDKGERIMLQRQLQTIEDVCCAAVLNSNILIEFINPSSRSAVCENELTFNYSLNESQKNAVCLALGDNPLSLVQGPPGTGKTQVIAEICLQILDKNPQARILVCSETHVAVNNLLQRLADYKNQFRILRVRDREQESGLDEFSPEDVIAQYNMWLQRACDDEDIQRIIKESLSDYSDPGLEKALILSSNIAGMTCNRVNAYRWTSEFEMFDAVIIDEVCKATLPEILAPLTVAKKAILVGDPQQLPPVFCSEDIDVIRSIDECRLQDYMYIDTLFSRCSSVAVLDTQYRMTNKIGSMISTLFYYSALKNGRNDENENCIEWVDYKPSAPCPVEACVGTMPNLINRDECQIVSRIIDNYDTDESEGYSIAVISPYRQQVNEIRNSLSKTHHVVVKVDTVDGFQGKECDIVIFCLTRTWGSFRFLADARRMNVALSRAKNKVIIIGNVEYAQKSTLLRRVLEYSSLTEHA